MLPDGPCGRGFLQLENPRLEAAGHPGNLDLTRRRCNHDGSSERSRGAGIQPRLTSTTDFTAGQLQGREHMIAGAAAMDLVVQKQGLCRQPAAACNRRPVDQLSRSRCCADKADWCREKRRLLALETLAAGCRAPELQARPWRDRSEPPA
jgi:hypothetical protein